MKPIEQMLMLAASPFASLFLLLSVLTPAYVSPAHGIDFWIHGKDQTWQKAYDQCGDDRLIVLQLFPAGRAKINQTEIDQAKLSDTLDLIFGTRRPRFLYIIADPRISVETVFSIAGEAQGRIPHLRIVPITPKMIRESHLTEGRTVSDRLWQRELAENPGEKP